MNVSPNESCLLLQVGRNDFESEVLASRQPVLVVFWAGWSRACSVLRPVLNELIKSSSGSVKFVEINADDNPDLSLWYEIHSIPVLLFFVDGVVRARITGTASKEAILAKLQSVSRNNDSSTHSEPSNEH